MGREKGNSLGLKKLFLKLKGKWCWLKDTFNNFFTFFMMFVKTYGKIHKLKQCRDVHSGSEQKSDSGTMMNIFTAWYTFPQLRNAQ